MRALVLSAIVLSGSLMSAVAAPAEALTTRDIIELSRAGLGEDVLVALIEVDASVFVIDPDTLKSLKAAGVSDKVIVALVRSGRDRVVQEPAPVADPPPAVDPAPQPQVVVIEHHEPPREMMVPVPVYVAVSPHTRHSSRAHSQSIQSTYVPFQSGLPAVRPVVQQPKEPVYWGFGGKLRPDAWKPEGHKESRRDSRKDSH
jgi:hypothetical protein